MRILFVSAEVAPFAKVGGLADVAGSLPKALKALGHDVRIVMPSYRMVEDRFELRRVVESMDVPLNPDWVKQAYVNEASLDGVPVYLVGTDEWYPNATSSETLYQPGSDPYLFLSVAALRVAEELDWKPDVVHANDWHTGFVPVLMRERHRDDWDDVGSVFTIHNLAYQGEFGFNIIDKLGLPHHLFNLHQLEFFGSINFLKAGCAFADQVNTVSERYAKEIQTPEFGVRLEGLMSHLARQNRLHGILNGIDDRFFNPATDPYIAAHYTAEEPSGKAMCRADLLNELQLDPIEGAPLLGVVSRLSGQKGMGLLLQTAKRLFEMPCQIVVQGLGDVWLTKEFKKLQEQCPEHFRFVNAFDVAMAQKIYAGCDGFLMPSQFEPCGLGQLIAMRYGTLPIVRETGGLADTVHEGRNGFVFQDFEAEAFHSAVSRAHSTFGLPQVWGELRETAMLGDYTWSRSAKEYERLYRLAINSRQQDRPQAKSA